MDPEDDDEGIFGGLYENGRWLWDEKLKRITFLSNVHPKTLDDMLYTYKEQAGTVEFREDVDLIEQMRYRRCYQRKLAPGQANIITLQDVKDLVLYTAPVNYLSEKLINMLHKQTTDRFLRALVLYFAYAMQVTDAMLFRTVELETKVRTPLSDTIEEEYQDNLADIRVLVAKEYCIILIGAGDMKPFHHMGPHKRQRSLLAKDANSFETFIRLCVQIVYLALGRRYFHQIELETHRLLKSEIFNPVEHNLQAVRAHAAIVHQRPNITKAVLRGSCLRRDRQLNTHSPLMNEVLCKRPVDYQMMGLGVVKHTNLTTRLRYFFLAVAGAEEAMAAEGIIIGIIGMPRTQFDIMLMPLPVVTTDAKSKASMQSQHSFASKSTVSMKKQLSLMKIYPDVTIPPKESVEPSMPIGFDESPEDIPPVNEVQRGIWHNRFKKMMSLQTQQRRYHKLNCKQSSLIM